jgi:hypothetical protein
MTPDILALMIPIIALGGGVLVVLVLIFAAHQRKMAEIVNQNPHKGLPAGIQDEVRELKVEVRQLRARLEGVAPESVERRIAEKELQEGGPPPFNG